MQNRLLNIQYYAACKKNSICHIDRESNFTIKNVKAESTKNQ